MENSPTPTTSSRPVRGLSMLSGGLDSQLAICVLRQQGIEMQAVLFQSPFFEIGAALAAAEAMQIKLHVVDFTDDILSLVEHPPHGFGSCMNPCVDCHARMLKRTGALMRELGCDFISTGEVLNQRPMSQNGKALRTVAEASGYAEQIVRPLSAKRLPPSRPEREGLVDRDRLLDFNGRTRKPQLALAAAFGLTDYPSPAGGCRLTEPNYARRLRDLKAHEGLRTARLIALLPLGRHLRLPGGSKLVVGRDQAENAAIEQAAIESDVRLRTAVVPGPTLLIPDVAREEDLTLAAQICAAYGDHGEQATVAIRIEGHGRDTTIEAAPLTREQFADYIL